MSAEIEGYARAMAECRDDLEFVSGAENHLVKRTCLFLLRDLLINRIISLRMNMVILL
jgi:hypothetical protein